MHAQEKRKRDTTVIPRMSVAYMYQRSHVCIWGDLGTAWGRIVLQMLVHNHLCTFEWITCDHYFPVLSGLLIC